MTKIFVDLEKKKKIQAFFTNPTLTDTNWSLAFKTPHPTFFGRSINFLECIYSTVSTLRCDMIIF